VDKALDLRPGRLHQRLALGKRLGGWHPVGAHPVAPYGQGMLHHPAHQGEDGDALLLHALTLLGAVVRGDALPILALAAPERARRTDDLLRPIGREALRARRPIALLPSGPTPVRIRLVARVHDPLALRSPEGLSHPLQGMPLPLLGQPRIG
jgi:hypothetical protein